MSDKYECDRCHKEFSIEDIAYLGPKNRGDESCDPLMGFECVCRGCDTKEADIPTVILPEEKCE